jgi:acetylglutamate kinase
VSHWCERLGLAPRFLEGLRVTDPSTLEVAVAVLAGLANKRLVAKLRSAGLDAVGLSGADAGIVDAVLHPDAERLGEVAAVRAIRTGFLFDLLERGRIPVLASIVSIDDGPGGRLLNLNADDLAAAVAGATKAAGLVLLSDTPGLSLGGKWVPSLSPAEIPAALASPDVTGGMRPKLLAASAALAGGTARVHLGSWQGPGTLRSLLLGEGAGTTLTAETIPLTERSR